MDSVKLNYIIAHLKQCFDGRPWYGNALIPVLEGIPWEKTNERVYGKKSIAVLVRHIINWRFFVLKKLQGDVEYDLIIDGPNDWSEVHISGEGDWSALLAELRETQQGILDELSGETDEILERKVPGKPYTFGDVLPSLSQHDIYHLGQIAMLRVL
ncbi:MAG: DinB family protein [Bacteroidota bacterium]